jgi:undecaprenyl-diphosphatase
MLVIVAGAGLLSFIALGAALLLAPAFVRLDFMLSAAIRAICVPGLTTAARIATTLGNFWPMFVVTVLTGIVLMALGHRTSGLTLMLSMLSGTLAGQLLKLLFMRVRPAFDTARIPIPDTYSFPSGHALAAVLYFGSLVILIMLNEKHLGRALFAAALCVFAALSIALSRVYLGVHYLGDVVGSWLFGIGWLALVVLVSARWGAGSQRVSRRPV